MTFSFFEQDCGFCALSLCRIMIDDKQSLQRVFGGNVYQMPCSTLFMYSCINCIYFWPDRFTSSSSPVEGVALLCSPPRCMKYQYWQMSMKCQRWTALPARVARATQPLPWGAVHFLIFKWEKNDMPCQRDLRVDRVDHEHNAIIALRGSTFFKF